MSIHIHQVQEMSKQVVTLWFGCALLPEGWAERVRLSIAQGRISHVETGVDALPGDERHAVALPGVPNVHSHGFQRAMAGLTESRGPGGDSFWSWRELVYRLVGMLTPEQVEAITAQAFMEMLETGFTRVGEFHYLHHAPDGRPYAHRGELAARVAAAAADTGIGLTLLPVFYAHGGFGGLDPAPAQRRFVTSVDEFAQLLEACRQATQRLDGSVVGVAPHSLRAVAPDELPRIVAMSQEGPIHIHVAEQEREVTDCVAWSGQRPVEWLLDHAEVDGRWCLVHATHMTRGETAALARRGAVAGLCPVTEANLGDGLFPAPEFLAAGGLAGIGSDSNVLIDAAEEMRVLEYGQRLTRRSRNVLCRGADRSTARTIFDAVQAGGARALGASPAGIAAGASADIVSLDATREVLLERKGDALLDGWVFAARDNVVDCVWRAGRAVVRHGRHVDRARIARRFARTLQELLR